MNWVLASKSLARSVLPNRVWGWLRVQRLRFGVRRYQQRVVEHSYAGHRLKVCLTDALAAGWYDHDWAELVEVSLLRTGKLRSGARVFDIGSHQGVVAMVLAAEVGPEGEVIAVEANAHNAAMIQRNCALNNISNVHVHVKAAAEVVGTLVFGHGLNGQVDDGSGAFGVQRVPCTNLDTLARLHGFPEVLFIDVEGYECQVLDGAREVLARRPDCMIEVHSGHGLEKLGGSLERLFANFPLERYALYGHSEDAPTPTRLRSVQDAPGGRFFLTALASTTE